MCRYSRMLTNWILLTIWTSRIYRFYCVEWNEIHFGMFYDVCFCQTTTTITATTHTHRANSAKLSHMQIRRMCGKPFLTIASAHPQFHSLSHIHINRQVLTIISLHDNFCMAASLYSVYRLNKWNKSFAWMPPVPHNNDNKTWHRIF